MAIESKSVLNRYGLTIGLQDKQRTYTVTIGDVSLSLVEFCRRIKIPYNSVVQALNRRSWPSGIYMTEFQALVSAMAKRVNRGTIQCPCCNGRGRIEAMYQANSSGVKLKPKVDISWTTPDSDIGISSSESLP